ncbi:MAG: metallophosphoesterase [Candidatus Woesearchaeota archaeon]
MTTFLCVADIHDNWQKLEKIVGFSKGCDAIIDAGDDFDQWLNGNDESAWLIKHKLPEENRDIINPIRRAQAIKDCFKIHYLERAVKINEYYKRAGIPVFATLGNHDPQFVKNKMTAVKYLVGSTAEFQGLAIAGLPATGEFVNAVLDFCPEFYPHLRWYDEISCRDGCGRISEAAKNLLGQSAIDIFVTHKGHKTLFRETAGTSRLSSSNSIDDYGCDAGAVAINRKFRPLLNVFGHYHLSKPLCEQHGGQWFVCPGRNSAVKIAIRDKAIVATEALYYT